MVNTAKLLVVALASFASVAFVTARGTETDLKITAGTSSNDDLLTMPLDESDLDNESSKSERRWCCETEKCKLFGGYCVKSRDDCDGMVDPQGCRGRGCQCCIPLPTCPTDPPTTTPQVPAGFEIFNGRVIRRTRMSDPELHGYNPAMIFCDQFGAKPFIPRTEADYLLYRENIDAMHPLSMCLPANDRLEEGILRWYNGEVSTDNSLWDWTNGQELFGNEEHNNCLDYNPSGVMFTNCEMLNRPPICEMI